MNFQTYMARSSFIGFWFLTWCIVVIMYDVQGEPIVGFPAGVMAAFSALWIFRKVSAEQTPVSTTDQEEKQA